MRQRAWSWLAALSSALLIAGATPASAAEPEAAEQTGKVWASLAAGSWHTCAIRTDGTLWCWGWNKQGRLGLGTEDRRKKVPTQVGTDSDWASLATGYGHTCALRTDGSLWCWGINFYGHLGLGDKTNRLAPTQVGTDIDWVSVAPGFSHTCARRTDGSLWCWGQNTLGELGLGDQEERLVPTRVGTDTDWADVSLGGHHTCATRTDASLWCWGWNGSGKLGLGDLEKRVVPTRVGTDNDWDSVGLGEGHSCAVRTTGSLWCWGSNHRGQLGVGDEIFTQTVPKQVGTGLDWASVASKIDTTCGIRAGTSLFCWGDNLGGQLGVGDTDDRSVPASVGAANWLQVTTGDLHSCAIRPNHSLWCWGSNWDGQLGLGDRDTRLTPTRV